MPIQTAIDSIGNTQGSPFGFKNRIINGAMVIDQRNAGASVTPTTDGTFSVDRWRCGLSVTSKFSVQQNAGSVTPPAGFTNYLGVTSLSGYTVGLSENFRISQSIEGFNTADLGWGTVNAQTVTLSFWVRSSLGPGTFGGAIKNSAETRVYPFNYSISASNTWEYKTITIPGDTTGTWVGATNGNGLGVHFSLGTGATVSGTAGAWQGGNLFSATSAVSVVGTNTATWYITGVQLEKAPQATAFDYRDYGRELIMCQRYYEKSYDLDAVPGTNSLPGLTYASVGSNLVPNAYGFMTMVFRVTKRAIPTMKIYNPGGTVNKVGNGDQADFGATVQTQAVGMRSAIVQNISGGSLNPSAGMTCAHFTADSEL